MWPDLGSQRQKKSGVAVKASRHFIRTCRVPRKSIWVFAVPAEAAPESSSSFAKVVVHFLDHDHVEALPGIRAWLGALAANRVTTYRAERSNRAPIALTSFQLRS